MGKVKFRPHHFLCTLAFQGKGYSPEFIKNYQDLVDHLRDDTEIQVTEEVDTICAPCPHRQGARCHSQEKITLLDQGHGEILKIKPDDLITWGEAKNRLKKHMTLEAFQQICKICQWYETGICQKALLELHMDPSQSSADPVQ